MNKPESRLTLGSNAPTMSSLELLDVINAGRAERAKAKGVHFPSRGHAELRHDTLMAKIENHPGVHSPEFSGEYLDRTGRKLKCYHLPEREARLMVMSESLEVQTRVLDRLIHLETQAQTLDTLLTQRPTFPSTATPLIDHPTYLELKALALKDAQWELKSLVGRRLRAYMHSVLVPDGSEDTLADPTPEADMVVMQMVLYVENALKLLEIENKVKARTSNLSLHKLSKESK